MSIKKEVASLLKNIAVLLEFKDENKFKVAAYKNASSRIQRIDKDLKSMITEGSLRNIAGIGNGIQKVIEEYVETGTSTEYENLKLNVPRGIEDMLKIRGIGPKKIAILYNELSIDSLETLEQSCKNDEIAKLKGFGEKIQTKILDEIHTIKKNKELMLLPTALTRGELLKNEISQLSSVENICFSGQLRRGAEVVCAIEFTVSVTSYSDFENEIANTYRYNKLQDTTYFRTMELFNRNNDTVEIHYSNKSDYGKTLLLSTGSEDFLIESEINQENISAETEEQIFAEYNLPFIIPEMREQEYFHARLKERSNSNLLFSDFKGLLHFHTSKSDGQNSLREMALSAIKLGFKYMAVCDHSKSAFYANGLTKDRILLQKEEIKELNSQFEIKIFHGIESDILRDGSLDYEDDILKTFQFVVASVHSIFNLSEAEMTSRIIKAVENPVTDLLAHPTGRLLLARDPYKVNVKKVIDACASNDVAIEINASPYRLDLDWRNIFYAREKGCKFAINPDAHSTDSILDIKYGIMMARKGGLQKKDVMNCYNLENFRNYINRKVNRNN